jgi:hypothetical protein
VPLEPGSSRAVIGHNIAEMEASGRPRNVAIAASLRSAGKTKRKKRRARLAEYVGK